MRPAFLLSLASLVFIQISFAQEISTSEEKKLPLSDCPSRLLLKPQLDSDFEVIEIQSCQTSQLDVFGALGLGFRSTRIDNQHSESLVARVRVGFEAHEIFRSQVTTDSTYDHEPEKWDFDRYPIAHQLDFRNRVNLSGPKNHQVTWFWTVDAFGEENGNLSIERRLRLQTGIGISQDQGDWAFSAVIGVYKDELEFDDDLPLSRSFDRSDLTRNGEGPYCQVQISGSLNETLSARLDASAYWDKENGKIREVPLRFSFEQELSGLARTICGQAMVLQAEYRYLDDHGLTGTDEEMTFGIFFERRF